jgi:hypothetical protein
MGWMTALRMNNNFTPKTPNPWEYSATPGELNELNAAPDMMDFGGPANPAELDMANGMEWNDLGSANQNQLDYMNMPGPAQEPYGKGLPPLDVNKIRGLDLNVGMNATDEGGGPVMTPQGGYDYGKPPTSPGMPQTPTPGMSDIAGGMAGWKPQTEATDRFNQLIANQPQYEGPGAWRTIAAALSAFGPGGHQTGMQVLNDPYNRAQQQWKEAIGPAQQAANLERYENTNARTLAYQTEQTRQGQLKIDNKAKQDEAMNKIREGNTRVRKMLAENPNFKVLPTEGGNVMLYDTKGLIKDPIDTGVKSGELDEETSLKIKQRDALRRIGEQGDVTTGHIDRRAAHAAYLKQLAPGKAAGDEDKPITDSAYKARLSNRFNELMARREDLAPFIDMEPGGVIRIKESGGWDGPTPAQREEIIKLLFSGQDKTVPGIGSRHIDEEGEYGVEEPPEPPDPSEVFSEPGFGPTTGGVQTEADAGRFAPSGGIAPTPEPRGKTPAPYTPNPQYANSRRIKVTSPDGRLGEIPEELWQKAQAAGFRRR